jgi:hypothetical protein
MPVVLHASADDSALQEADDSALQDVEGGVTGRPCEIGTKAAREA